MDPKHFSVVTGAYIRRNKFDDTIAFLVLTSVQCVKVVHGPQCLLRYSLKIGAMEILCRMKVVKRKGMTNHTNCSFEQAEKTQENKRAKIFRC